jgi:competence protein ComEA
VWEVLVAESSPDVEFWGVESRFERLRRPGGVGGGSFHSLMDRVRDPRVGVVALVVLALVAGVVFYKVGSGSADAATSPAGPATSRRAATGRPGAGASSAAASSTTAPVAATGGKGSGAKVVVHVAGAVVTPGVVQLAAGSRVIDAVEAAGGGLPNADLDRLNLAAKLVDGQRVLVQHVGDPPAAADPAPGDGSGTGAPAGPLNLNTATQAELEQLPGIGPSLAQAILAERARRGGFRSVNELREVRGIGERRFADLKSVVTV